MRAVIDTNVLLAGLLWVGPIVEYLKNLGVHLYFLPAYSPELNRIERVWHKMKHTWMEVKHRTEEMLEADVCHILDKFGSKYKSFFEVRNLL